MPGQPARCRVPRRAIQALLIWGAFSLCAWSLHSLVVAAPADAQAEQRGSTRADPEGSGEALWRRDCASCHGPGGDGTRWGPDIQEKGPAGVHLMVTTGRMPIEDLDWLGDPAPGEDAIQVLPDNGRESEYLPGQVAALVAYSRTILDGPDAPTVDVAGADISRGSELFQRNCASCHAWSARGGILASGHVATTLEGSTPQEVVEAMRTGLGTMPVFPDAVIDDAGADDIAAYVEYMQHPRDAGGFPLGYLGPVAEGLAAGVFGILLLLLIARWIGTRS